MGRTNKFALLRTLSPRIKDCLAHKWLQNTQYLRKDCQITGRAKMFENGLELLSLYSWDKVSSCWQSFILFMFINLVGRYIFICRCSWICIISIVWIVTWSWHIINFSRSVCRFACVSFWSIDVILSWLCNGVWCFSNWVWRNIAFAGKFPSSLCWVTASRLYICSIVCSKVFARNCKREGS